MFEPMYQELARGNNVLLATSCTCSTQLFSAANSGSTTDNPSLRILNSVSVTKSTCCSIDIIILLFTEGLPGPVIINKLGKEADIKPR